MANDYTNLIYDIGHSDTLVDAEQPIVVNAFTKNSEIPAQFNKQIGVVGDHKSNLVTFQCDRIIDGHDTKDCYLAFVKWQNQGSGQTGSYVVSDRHLVDGDPDKTEFHWEVESDVTSSAGTVKFQICFMDYSEDGTKVIYRWNSNPNSELYIGEGIFDPDVDGPVTNNSGGFVYSGAISII